MKNLKLILEIFLLGLLVAVVSRCGQQYTGTNNCTPNVIAGGLQLKVAAVSSGSMIYQMTLCGPAIPSNAVYSVYGGVAQADVTNGTINLQGAVRQAHITGATAAGENFQVPFNGSDNYFAIYQDALVGSTYTLSSTVSTMVDPRLIPR